MVKFFRLQSETRNRRKIIVHERDTSPQKIEIHYSFGLGKLIITEDELIKQEKIRKTKKQYDHKCDQYCLFLNISYFLMTSYLNGDVELNLFFLSL